MNYTRMPRRAASCALAFILFASAVVPAMAFPWDKKEELVPPPAQTDSPETTNQPPIARNMELSTYKIISAL